MTEAYSQFENNLRRALNAIAGLPTAFWRTLVTCFALLWLCNSLAVLFWVMMPKPELRVPDKWVEARPATSSTSRSASIDPDKLAALAVFGSASGPVAEATPAPQVQVQPGIEDGAAKTSLDLTLVGVLVSNKASESTATIAKGLDQQLYRIDDKLPAGNNVTLAKVLSDRVILNNNGRFESLWLYSEKDFNSSGHATTYASGPVNAPPPVPLSRVQEASIRPEDVPQTISDVVRFSVERQEGKMIGFRIRPGRDQQLFESLGLQPNDIVTAVNGVKVDNPQALRDNYNDLKNANSADLEILRNGETIYINISVDAVGN